jgi:hypothetical protein
MDPVLGSPHEIVKAQINQVSVQRLADKVIDKGTVELLSEESMKMKHFKLTEVDTTSPDVKQVI